MASRTTANHAELVGDAAIPLTGGAGDYDPLLEMIGEERLVLLGEASHGTHEFYAERARITRRLIEEKGFAAIAVEAWPDAYRVNCWVRGRGGDAAAEEALRGFERFPQWCGATPTWWTSWDGCGTTTTASRTARPGWGSTASTSTSSSGPSRR